MEMIRASLIQQLSAYSQDEDQFLSHAEQLAQAQGGQIYTALLSIFTQLDFSEEEAEPLWKKMIEHRQLMMKFMKRSVNLTTAICDYMLTVQKALIHPKIVELNLFEETHHYSKCDSLTGLYNRSFFEDALKSEASRSNRYKTEFSLVFLDVDHFKTVNDLHGHMAGDLVLKTLAKLIQSEKRAEDIAARFGGEEIVLILPGTGKYRGLNIAERIRKAVAALEMNFAGRKIQVTLSGGVATFPLDTDRVAELVDCADRALYRAKHKGRNRMVLFSDDKRHNYRMDVMGPIKVQQLGMRPSEKPTLGRIKDISLSGVLFESQQAIPEGSRIQLEVPLSTSERPLIMVGQVTRLRSDGGLYDVGANFLHFGDQDRQEINKHFSNLLHSYPATH